jgi:hypothetical protein
VTKFCDLCILSLEYLHSFNQTFQYFHVSTYRILQIKHNKQNKLQIKQNKVHVTQHSTGIRSHQREHLRDETVSRNIISIFTLLWYYGWSLNPETCSYCTSVIHYRHKTNHFSCWKFLSSHQLKENHCFELVWSKTILCVCFFFFVFVFVNA